MTPERQAAFRMQLEQMLAELERAEEMGKDGQKPVELDQQSVGRLARMDALQNQAMAQAGGRRRAAAARRIAAALARVDDGSFGECSDCGEDIPEKRLEIDPTTPLCVSCASG
ncbi:TraR/DksA family transcriptional regulator [Rhodovulum sp. 12E13]|uniref:TraR/DksA family transcriptional regulator n=1 Tax=Rhodovulum sp. 12E13 TaxID=2203891 RepID=UPI000E1AFFE5|nr:TraR/DksA C4-type zinc finger protein [Rhodovulum sp. 12E13]RDC74447.1 TraR/DksA family transcriptional regulator [Rhodovulum sp. 12E13]